MRKLEKVNRTAPCLQCKRFMAGRGDSCKCLRYRIWWARVEREVYR
jgi:hypothetical protein